MKKLKAASLIILVFLAFLLSFYAIYGGFKKVECRVTYTGGELFVYEEIRGDYQRISYIVDSLYESLLQKKSIENIVSCMVYYPDSMYTNKNAVGAEVGCIVDVSDSLTLYELQKTYKIKTLPLSNYVVAAFPYKGKTSLTLASMKLYPAIDTFLKDSDLQVKNTLTEVYDIKNKKIIFRKEILK
ncbi:MAG: hypothetical protein GX330_00420 [Bacteroidales bacterium]|nr:hypothetical protein [Bacteroidales bacterium]